MGAIEDKVGALHAGHGAKKFADGFGRVHGAEAGGGTGQAVVGESPAERLGRVRLEVQPNGARRTPGEVLPGEEIIELAAVETDRVGDVRNVFEAAFDLEGRDAGVNEIFQVVREVQILQRQQVAIFRDGFALVILERVAPAARLSAPALVAAAPTDGVAQVTLAAGADTDVRLRMSRT